jgi:penicillin-binding protein 1A
MPVTSIYSYFVDQVISDVRTDLIKSGYTEKQANNLIYNSGISIYATQDSDIQAAIDSEFTNIENFPINKNLEPDKQGQAAMVILDQRNGQILGMYGGYGKKEASLSFNRATQMYRSPGSSIKPLLIYGPAIDNHLITPATVVDDSPCRLDPQYPDKLWPTNFSNNYRGLTTVRQAIIDSTNVVATKTFLDYTGYDLGLSYLKNLGMDRYEDKGKPAISLGGFYKAMNPMLMAAGYAAFANDGSYYEPTTYTKVVDNSGKTLLDKKPISTLVYKDDRTPYMMTNMLHDVVTKGSASQNINIKNAAGESIYTAGKTGTSTDQEDLWFVGYTAYYTCATWYGYDNSKSVPSGDEYFTSQRLWNKVMTKIHANLEPKEFTRPDGIVEADVCKVSGEMPTQICLDDPRGEVYREIFMSGTEPSSPCSVHKSVQICDLSHDNFGKHELAGPFCPIADVNTVWGTYRKVLPDFRPGDPFPDDWGYELSHAGICTLHNSVEPPPENTTMPATPDMPIDTPSPSPSITYPDTPSPPEQTPVISTQTPEPEPEPEETLSPDE